MFEPVDPNQSDRRRWPARNWYVRVNRYEEEYGPFTKQNANFKARDLSEERGSSELYDYDDEGNARVLAIYIRGKLRFRGRVAEDRSRRGSLGG